MNQNNGADNNFVFVTTQVSYGELSDIAMKHNMTVAQFVGRAILDYISKIEKLNQSAGSGQEAKR